MTPADLQLAGLPEEAARLAFARQKADIWSRGGARISDRALALSVFGSKRFDELERLLSR